MKDLKDLLLESKVKIFSELKEGDKIYYSGYNHIEEYEVKDVTESSEEYISWAIQPNGEEMSFENDELICIWHDDEGDLTGDSLPVGETYVESKEKWGWLIISTDENEFKKGLKAHHIK